MIGKNKGKLVSPCKCIKQFIHVHCLEISANTQNVLDCPFCYTRYPLDIRCKSLLEVSHKRFNKCKKFAENSRIV